MSPSSAALKIAPTYPSEPDEPPPTQRWARADLEHALATFRSLTDDEPTLEVPAPFIPAWVRSPIGDDDEVVSSGDIVSAVPLASAPVEDGVPWGVAGTWAAAVSLAVASAFVATTSEPAPIDNGADPTTLAAVPTVQR